MNKIKENLGIISFLLLILSVHFGINGNYSYSVNFYIFLILSIISLILGIISKKNTMGLNKTLGILTMALAILLLVFILGSRFIFLNASYGW